MSSHDGPLRPLVVLVHGAWHGAWCWAGLQAELDRRGIASIAVDLPGHGASSDALTGLTGDAEALATTLDHVSRRFGRPIALVGHSYGGAVITQAAVGRSDIAHLVYVAAFALDDHESVIGALMTFERHDTALSAAIVAGPDDVTTLDPAAAPAALYGCCDPATVTAALPRLGGQTMSSMSEPVSGAPRATIESTYVVCAQDQAVHPDHQRVMAQRCTHAVTLDTDHSPFISATSDLAHVIENVIEKATDRTEPS